MHRLTLLVIVATLLGLSAPGCSPAERPRLILLIIVDTLRADRLGCYGHEQIETPNLDELANRGTLYENAMTAVPVTLPSVATIITGAYPLQHGVRDNGLFALSQSWETLPERLQSAGYRTAAFVSAAVLARGQGLDQGFEIYDDDMTARYETYHPAMQSMSDDFQGIERRASLTIDRALAWALAHRDEPVMLTVHLFDPHLPRDPPPEFRDRYAHSLYDGEIAYVDREVGRLLDGLATAWKASETLTVFVGDHGEGLMDHEEDLHGVLLFEETTHVPLILAGFGIENGRREQGTVRTADLPATICSVLGISSPERSIGAPLPGILLPDGIRSEARRDPLDGVAYLETFRSRLSHGWCELRALRTDRWKVISGPRLELYDLQNDPDEKSDLAETMPAVRDSLAALMDAVALRSLAQGNETAQTRQLSQEERDRLFSLGYVTPQEVAPAGADSLAVWYFPPEQRGPALGLSNPRARLVDYNNRTTARSYSRSGLAALNKGNLEGAEQRFRVALHYDSTHVEAHLGLAEVFQRYGQADRAIVVLRHAARQEPADSKIALELSNALTSLGRRSEALRVIERALQAGAEGTELRDRRDRLRALGASAD